MRCKYCGAEIDNDSVFCPECGKNLSKPEQQGNQRSQGNQYQSQQGRPQGRPHYAPRPQRPQTSNGDPKSNLWWILLMVLVLLIGIYFLFFHTSKKSDARDREESEAVERRASALADSINLAKASAEQQLLQDSLMKVAKAKSDSLALLKDSLKHGKNTKDNKGVASTTGARAARGSSSSGRRNNSTSDGVIRRDAGLVVGTRDMGYGTFRGTLRNGLPHDVSGRMIFKVPHLIDSRDPKGRMAEAGDYVIGEFVDGHLVQGIWYGPDRQVKGSIIIGR